MFISTQIDSADTEEARRFGARMDDAADRMLSCRLSNELDETSQATLAGLLTRGTT